MGQHEILHCALEDLGELWPHTPSTIADTTTSPPDLSAEEAAVLAALSLLETPADLIIETTGLPAPVVTATLLKLEMRHLVRALPGFRYARL